MKLSTTIMVLQDLLGDGPYWPPVMRRQAVQQGIEALERIQDGRLQGYDYFGHRLPSETDTDEPHCLKSHQEKQHPKKGGG